MEADRPLPPALTPLEQLRCGKEAIAAYASTLADLAGRLGARFCEAADLLFECRGSVIVSGMGKAGLIGQKITATLASIGTRSHYLHPAEAMHGDLGRIHRDDVVLIFSQSGETAEVLRMLPSLAEFGVPMVAVTCRPNSSLGKAAAIVLDLGPIEEACPLGLAPTTSAAAMLAMGDALALVVSRMRRFEASDFARFHPGGSLGFRLSRVEDNLRPLEECRVANEKQSVRSVFVGLCRPGRRTGAIMLVNDEGQLTGLFTDSDLARLFERRNESALDAPICTVMTARPLCVRQGAPMSQAVELLGQRKISELPVVDAAGCPLGLIDVTDILSHLPKESENLVAGASPGSVSGSPARARTA